MRLRIMPWVMLLVTLLGATPAYASEHEPPLVTKWVRMSVPQGYPIHHYQEIGYRITAGAGPLRLGMIHYEAVPTPLFDVALVQGEQVLATAELTSTETTAEFTLPAAGEYYVWVRPLFEWSESASSPQLSLSAVDLSMRDNAMNFVNVPDLPEFYHVAVPMDLEVGPGSSDNYISRITINNTVIFETGTPDSRPVRLHLDPADIPDGLYWLEMEASATRDRHRSYTYRSLLIDQEAQYTDVPHWHWARQPVEIMSHLAILNGRGDGTYDPDVEVKRKEFAKMVALTFDLTASGPSPFADAPGDWSQPYIDALYEAGLITGEIEDGKRYFRPDRSITRAEATTIIGRALGDTDVSALPPLFLDDDQIPAWALPAVAVLYVERWVSGFPDGTFSPGQQLSRAQVAKLLAHALGLTPGDRDSGGGRPPGIPSGWMFQGGGTDRRRWNPGFARADLEPLWVSPVYPVRGSYMSNLAVGNGLLYVAGQRGRVYALLPENGEILWETVVGTPVANPGKVAYSPTHNLVYATTWTGQVVALHPVTGKKVWESAERWTWADNSPVVSGDLVITGQGALHAETGAVVWRGDSFWAGAVAASGDRIFTVAGPGRVAAYRASDGSPLWERDSGHIGGGPPPPVVAHGLVFAADVEDHMLALDEATGAVVWRRPGVGQPLVDDRYVWVPLPRSGGLAVVEPATGATVATVDVCAWSLAVGATHAYAACDGAIAAISRETFEVAPVAPGEVVLGLDGERLYYLADDPSPWEYWMVGALGAGTADLPPRADAVRGNLYGRMYTQMFVGR